jgi:hypothetical protein
MHRSVWLLAVVVAVTGVCLATPALAGRGPAHPGKGGNSANAKACQKGGWMNLVRSDQSSFNNQGACVSYGAHGGALLAAADRAYCAPSGPPTFGQCFYTASAELMLPRLDLDFAASSGPGGQTPSGNFRFEQLPLHWAGVVTCLEFENGGHVADIGGVITDSNARPVGSGFSFAATDNAPDDISTFTYRASPPTANTPLCGISSAHSLNEGFLEVVSGDIVVKDG